jgi:hypothetical protein
VRCGGHLQRPKPATIVALAEHLGPVPDLKGVPIPFFVLASI